MRYHRADVVEAAIGVLDRFGLPDLTMRRLGRELGVQPSALYHHFPDKQTLLAAVADELLARGRRRRPLGECGWRAEVAGICGEIRDAGLAYRDGAEVIATAYAFGLGAGGPVEELREVLAAAGVPGRVAGVGARTLLHFVLGHAVDEQTHLQADSAGAIPDLPRESGDFATGLALITDGLAVSVIEAQRAVASEGSG